MLPGGFLDQLETANAGLAEVNTSLQNALPHLTTPARLAAEGRLPRMSNALESARDELTKLVAPVAAAKEALEETTALAPDPQASVEVRSTVEAVVLIARQIVGAFPAGLKDESAKLTDVIDNMPDVTAPLQDAQNALSATEDRLVAAEPVIKDAKPTLAAAETIGRLIEQVETLSAVADALTPSSINANLIENRIYGPDELSFHEGQIDKVRKAIARGADTAIYEQQIADMEKAITQAGQADNFYRQAAEQMKDAATIGRDLYDRLQELQGDVAGFTEVMASGLADTLDRRYIDKLREAHKGLSIVNELADVPNS